MFVVLRSAVGHNGKNYLDDVGKVQTLLNQSGATPRLAVDEICGPKTVKAIHQYQKTIMSRSDGRIDPGGKTLKSLNQIQKLRSGTCSIFSEGPQSFAGSELGKIPVSQCLLDKNRQVAQMLMSAAAAYKQNEDFRWFFTHAHGRISEKINRNITKFQRPNALIRLNLHFATEYLRAVNGLPHKEWKNAFNVCKIMEVKSKIPLPNVLPLEVEACGATMANVHIGIDLAAALSQIGCIPPNDYGNVLLFVQQGAESAINELRGVFIGWIVNGIKAKLPNWLQLEEVWRNAAYEQVCSTAVPSIEPIFSISVKP